MSRRQGLLVESEEDFEDEIQGTLERVVYTSSESGYSVLRFKDENTKNDVITAVGNMPSPRPGSFLKLKGKWIQHPKFGQQFQFIKFEEQRPESLEGMRMFLGSGIIKGMRKRWADKVVDYFGKETFHVLDHEPERLLEIPKLSKKLLDSVKESWAEQAGIREIMVFLNPHGIGTALALRLYKYYGQNTIDIIKENPYIMAMEVQGIGFLTADNFAMSLGFEPDSPLRAKAGALYILERQCDEGHVYLPQDELLRLTSTQLNIDEVLVENAIKELEKEEYIVTEYCDEYKAIYLTRYHHCETKIAFYLHRLISSPSLVFFNNREEEVNSVIRSLPISLANAQEEAIRVATQSKMMVLTGGPGTGKTTIINGIIQIYQKAKAKILLAAPTGRAAKRMSETSGLEAKTIHRLLEYNPSEDGFSKNENNPLSCSLLIIDEASMIDTILMYHLVKAIPAGCIVIFVGDVNQLPSVGAGNILRDLILSNFVPVVELHEIFRQAARSQIIQNAHKINEGLTPSLKIDSQGLSDFYFFPEEDPNIACQTIIDLVSRRIPLKYKFNSISEIQVLSPMLKGPTGVNNLNEQIQLNLNKSSLALIKGEKKLALNDKVMQIKNNYDKDIYNGDIGIITNIDLEDKSLLVRFDDRQVPYLYEELDELVLAYCISIHKSQGGEYPCVVLPLLKAHYVMLQRNLLYTAVTRGKKLVVIVGSPTAMHMAVQNNKINFRYTYLANRLMAIE